jgi:peptidyl-prolyl cis-trans isomerase A (cyclophilin A)
MESPVRRLTVAVLALTLGMTTAFARVSPPQEKKDLTKPELFTETAPATFTAQFDTSVGPFIVKVTRNWAPNGADRFYNLVKNGFYDENRFHRVVRDVLVQFGMHGDPKVSAAWLKAYIKPDRAKQTNTRGRLAFAVPGSNQEQRSTAVFINYGDNSKTMDSAGFAPFGEVTSSMVLVERIFDRYGEGPDPVQMLLQGNAYLKQVAPAMDYIKTATIIPDVKK